MSTTTESFAFQAEVKQVLNLVVHSLYSNKEIFLRELISNASDALDKLRFESLQRPELLDGAPELKIQIEYDEGARTLTVRDSGIGMSREEVIENLGTIARSGTRRFLEALSAEQKQDANLIGQFGVGFYSAFIVADRVVVTTRRAGAPAESAVRFECSGTDEYTLAPAEPRPRGTEIVLHLKAGEEEFARPWRLRALVQKYSDHIAFPIELKRAEVQEGEAPFEQINRASALWTRPKSELKDEDYQGFYRHLAHDSEDALAWAHNRVEGAQSYTTLLYLPAKMPFDALYAGREERRGLKLYVRRVFIMDAAEQLLPGYLRFVRGVVDSDDLPLNVSRELLQDNRLVGQIRSSIIKRVLDLLDKLAGERPEDYRRFFTTFGAVLKEGLGEDYAHRDRIAKLLRFATTATEGAEPTASFDDYVARMRPGQTQIYYLSAESHLAARHSPHLEALKRKGVEVILLSDRVDEWAFSQLPSYADKPLRSVAKGALDLSAIADLPEAGERQPEATLPATVAEKVKQALGERVKEVRGSARLTESAACLVVEDYDMALHLQRILKQAGRESFSGAPTLELNPSHPLVQRLAQDLDPASVEQLSLFLYEQALLSEGAQLEDPSGFIKRMNALLSPNAV